MRKWNNERRWKQQKRLWRKIIPGRDVRDFNCLIHSTLKGIKGGVDNERGRRKILVFFNSASSQVINVRAYADLEGIVFYVNTLFYNDQHLRKALSWNLFVPARIDFASHYTISVCLSEDINYRKWADTFGDCETCDWTVDLPFNVTNLCSDFRFHENCWNFTE